MKAVLSLLLIFAMIAPAIASSPQQPKQNRVKITVTSPTIDRPCFSVGQIPRDAICRDGKIISHELQVNRFLIGGLNELAIHDQRYRLLADYGCGWVFISWFGNFWGIELGERREIGEYHLYCSGGGDGGGGGYAF